MRKSDNKNYFVSRLKIGLAVISVCAGSIAILPPKIYAQEAASVVEMNGDEVEFSIEQNKVYAKGNVSISRNETKLTCEELEFSRDTKIAVATGHVVLTMAQGTISGDKMTFNFDNMTGEFMGAKIYSNPYYGAGQSMSKVADNHIQMRKAYLTSCDLDDPHYRLSASKMDIFMGDKAVARNVGMWVGKVPLFYFPRYTQVLSDKKPRVLYTPGYTKDWGAFLLQSWRYYLNDDLKGIIHLDYRERKDFASGVDAEYKTLKYGKGVVRTYYMNERNITSKRFYDERPSPTIERERFKVEWRHKWQIDETTDAILQYYRLSDADFLKDYFEKEYDKDSNPGTFFTLTKALPKGTLSFLAEARVNRFVSAVERLPELRYDLPNQKIGDTNFYFRSVNSFSNLTKKTASPSEIRQETMRIDTDDELSYPFKVAFIELRPFVGGRQTYYSKTNDQSYYGVTRGIFRTGADVSTRFYRMFDVDKEFLGQKITKLRHIVTPSVAYGYTHDPTIPSSRLDQFDSIDSADRSHGLTFSLENKFQTKRKGKTVDLLRFVLDTDFALKENRGKGGFNLINADIEFMPTDWLSFYTDSQYNAQTERLTSTNFDLYINGPNWNFSIGKRYNVDADDQITAEWSYVINPKWKIRVYERFDAQNGILKEQNYSITRDLHCWEMEINFNETRNEGDEILLVFRLKAFPDIGFDFGTSFNKRKTGSQTY
ncbi:MAG: LPS assembly protein LptD [Candidatus Omnitrophota bacterium]